MICRGHGIPPSYDPAPHLESLSGYIENLYSAEG
jgi:hypothetical protein